MRHVGTPLPGAPTAGRGSASLVVERDERRQEALTGNTCDEADLTHAAVL